MSHTYAQNTVHVVFSTKERRRSISPELQPRLYAYIAGFSHCSLFLIVFGLNAIDFRKGRGLQRIRINIVNRVICIVPVISRAFRVTAIPNDADINEFLVNCTKVRPMLDAEDI